MPVGAELTASCGLKPMPLLVCSTNHGSIQPTTMNTRPPITSAQKLHIDSSRALIAAVAGTPRLTAAGSSATAPAGSSATIGHAHAEQSHGAEHEHDDQHREDDRVVPCGSDELSTEHLDQPDEEAADAGTDDVADTAEHSARERDDAEAKAQVPDDDVVLDAVDHAPSGGQR